MNKEPSDSSSSHLILPESDNDTISCVSSNDHILAENMGPTAYYPPTQSIADDHCLRCQADIAYQSCEESRLSREYPEVGRRSFGTGSLKDPMRYDPEAQAQGCISESDQRESSYYLDPSSDSNCRAESDDSIIDPIPIGQIDTFGQHPLSAYTRGNLDMNTDVDPLFHSMGYSGQMQPTESYSTEFDHNAFVPPNHGNFQVQFWQQNPDRRVEGGSHWNPTHRSGNAPQPKLLHHYDSEPTMLGPSQPAAMTNRQQYQLSFDDRVSRLTDPMLLATRPTYSDGREPTSYPSNQQLAMSTHAFQGHHQACCSQVEQQQLQGNQQHRRGSPSEEDYVEDVQGEDVLLGRGPLVYQHPGNMAFHQEKKKLQGVYLNAPIAEKKEISQQLVNKVKGRFLKFDWTRQRWYKVNNSKRYHPMLQ